VELQLATDRPFVFVLAGDPAMQRCNPEGDLALYRLSSKGEELKIPEDATLLTAHALTSAEIARAEAKAGRLWRKGQRLYQEMVGVISSAGAENKHTASEALDEFLDGLSDEDAESFRIHERWLEQRSLELCRLAIEGVSSLSLRPERGLFPVEVLERAFTSAFARAGLYQQGSALIREASEHIVRVGRLGKGTRISLPSRFGEKATLTGEPGTASNALAGTIPG